MVQGSKLVILIPCTVFEYTHISTFRLWTCPHIKFIYKYSVLAYAIMLHRYYKILETQHPDKLNSRKH